MHIIFLRFWNHCKIFRDRIIQLTNSHWSPKGYIPLNNIHFHKEEFTLKPSVCIYTVMNDTYLTLSMHTCYLIIIFRMKTTKIFVWLQNDWFAPDLNFSFKEWLHNYWRQRRTLVFTSMVLHVVVNDLDY